MTIQTAKADAERLITALSVRRSRILSSPVVTRAAECLTRFFLTMVLTGAEVFDGCRPFGTAMTAASGAGIAGFGAVAGAIAGSFMDRSWAQGLQFAAPAFLSFAAARIFRRLSFSNSSWFMPLMTALMSACTGFVYLAEAGFGVAEVVWFAAGVVLTGACTYFYRRALEPWSGVLLGLGDFELSHTLSVLILLMSICLSAADIYLPLDISVGRLMALEVVLYSSYLGGMGIGCVTGVCAGAAIDISFGGVPVCTSVFAFLGLISGAFRNAGKLLYFSAFLTALAVVCMWMLSTASYAGLLPEALICILTLAMTPDTVLKKLRRCYRSGEYTSAQFTRQYAGNRLTHAAAGFLALGDIVKEAQLSEERENETMAIFRSASMRVCRSCPMSGSCWERDRMNTENLLKSASEGMMRRGRPEKSDFPEEFVGKCQNFSEFLAASGEALRAQLYRRQFVSRMNEAQETIRAQYVSIHALLSECVEGLNTETAPIPHSQRLTASVGISTVRRHGEHVNGDTSRCFRTPDGTLCMILSDGMGTGREAARDSGDAVTILEELLTAGIAPATALSLLNSALRIRGGEEPRCTTIDLMCTDLSSGSTELFKYGSAPTYVKRGRVITRIAGFSAAAGLSLGGNEPDFTCFELAPGDCAVIASDGVASGSDDEWLTRSAAEYDGNDPRALSRRLLREAVQRYGRVDDMTVAVLRVTERI